MADAKGPTSNPVNDLWWILAVFIGFGLLWFASGGASTTNQNSNQPNNKDEVEEKEVPPKNTVEIADDIKDVERKLARIQEEIRGLMEESRRSPLYGKISISSSGRDDNLNEEYIRLRISSSFNDKVPVTGLTLYSPLTGKSAVIGPAVEIPRVGKPNQSVSIMASPGDTIYVLTGTSPLGISFRTNLCTGYLAQYQSFEPRLHEQCPAGDEEAEYLQVQNALGSACMEKLEDLNRCEVFPNPNLGDNNCNNFVTSNLNYNACVSNHFGDTEFPGTEWRVYLNAKTELWRNDDDIIELLDANNKIIDAVSI